MINIRISHSMIGRKIGISAALPCREHALRLPRYFNLTALVRLFTAKRRESASKRLRAILLLLMASDRLCLRLRWQRHSETGPLLFPRQAVSVVRSARRCRRPRAGVIEE